MIRTASLLAITSASAFVVVPHRVLNSGGGRCSRVIVKGSVADDETNAIGRIWRCKLARDDGDASLLSAQVAYECVLDEIQEVGGYQKVENIVCEESLEFKVITWVDVDKFESWKAANFDPEDAFLEMLGDIDGISAIETESIVSSEI